MHIAHAHCTLHIEYHAMCNWKPASCSGHCALLSSLQLAMTFLQCATTFSVTLAVCMLQCASWKPAYEASTGAHEYSSVTVSSYLLLIPYNHTIDNFKYTPIHNHIKYTQIHKHTNKSMNIHWSLSFKLPAPLHTTTHFCTFQIHASLKNTHGRLL